jgi:tetratricopeptide (TPR) repeat protein
MSAFLPRSFDRQETMTRTFLTACALAATAVIAPVGAAAASHDTLAAAERRISRNPEDPAGYQSKAMALMALQRETGDPELYVRAEKALLEAKRRAPEDYQTRKLLAWVVAGEHRFPEALELARECARRNPSDSWNYGVMADALTELGRYEEAVTAVQTMVDLRPGAPSYARAAHQRHLRGDVKGALALYQTALEATAPADHEGVAWLRSQRAETCFQYGDRKAAAAEIDRALAALPGYPMALALRARLAAAQGRLSEAAETWRGLLARVPRADWRAALGDVYAAMGRRREAAAEYARVERELRAQLSDSAADAGHQLADFLADHGRDPKRALALARADTVESRDVRGMDTLAWALYRNGRYAEAWDASASARRLGTRDSRLLFHAGMIALKLPARQAEGRRLLREALALNAGWSLVDAPVARRVLAVRPAMARR